MGIENAPQDTKLNIMSTKARLDELVAAEDHTKAHEYLEQLVAEGVLESQRVYVKSADGTGINQALIYQTPEEVGIAIVYDNDGIEPFNCIVIRDHASEFAELTQKVEYLREQEDLYALYLELEKVLDGLITTDYAPESGKYIRPIQYGIGGLANELWYIELGIHDIAIIHRGVVPKMGPSINFGEEEVVAFRNDKKTGRAEAQKVSFFGGRQEFQADGFLLPEIGEDLSTEKLTEYCNKMAEAILWVKDRRGHKELEVEVREGLSDVLDTVLKDQEK